MGKVECDDGNNLSNDGCSSNCKIEPGYKCIHRSNLPDSCIDTDPPKATLSINSGNVLVLRFSETVMSSVDSKALADSMEVTLDGVRTDDCNLTWNLNSTFKANTELNLIVIKTRILCSITGRKELFTVKFNDPSLITDAGYNILDTPSSSVLASKYAYVSDFQRVVIKGAGNTFSATSLTTFGIVVGCNLVFSTTIGSFWSFLNMLQMISYVPIIPCDLPYNLNILLTQYLVVSQANIPFEILSGYVPTPLSFLKRFATPPLNDRFYNCGYPSVSFVYNFGDQFATWIVLALTYCVLIVINKYTE